MKSALGQYTELHPALVPSLGLSSTGSIASVYSTIVSSTGAATFSNGIA